MSNATIIQTNQDIFIGSDTATSTLIGDQLYRVDTKAKKLFHINNMVLFCSGELTFCYNLIELFLKQEVRNVSILRQILLALHLDETIDIVICEYKGNKTIVTQLSPYNKFEPVIFTDIPVGGLNIISAGIRTRESYEATYGQLNKGKSIPKIFKSIFNTISYEGIGGTLRVYRINKHGIVPFLQHQIKEKDSIKLISPAIIMNYAQEHLIVGERLYGKVVSGVNLAIEDEHGIVKWQGSKSEIFDRNGKHVMKMGLVDENPDVFGLWSFNDITRVRMDDKVGFTIEKATTDTSTYPDGWQKLLWADQADGTLYTRRMIAENIKIVNNVGNTILDAESNYMNLGDFETIAMDNKLTSLEKMQIITELYKIEAQYKRMLEQAEEYKRSQRDDVLDINAQFLVKTPSAVDLYSTLALSDAYSALIVYMSQFVKMVTTIPLNINIDDPMTSATSVITSRAEFILKFKNYYDAEKDLRNKIEDAQFYSGLNMGQFYNNVVIGEYGFIALRSDGKYRSVLNATNGLALQKWENNRWNNKVYGSIGSTTYEDGTLIAEDLVAKRLRIETKNGGVLLDVDSLNFDFTKLDSIILDNVIMSPEKITLSSEFKNITKQYTELKAAIMNYASTIYNDRDSTYTGLDTAKANLLAAGTDLDNKYSALSAYMAPVFIDMNAKTDIVNDLHSTRTDFHAKWEDFYKAYETGRNRVADFLEKSSIQLGRNYNNTVIDAENGIVVTRGNMMNRAIMNATKGFALQQNDGTAQSPIWVDKFYAGIDGKFYAEELQAKRLRIFSADGDMLIDGDERKLYLNKFDIIGAGLITSEHIITNTITADNGYIADLTVNHLKTLAKDGAVGSFVD
ncbi:hypothetical protein [Paenibacillus sacheonensis]|uniref:Prophage tail endopeptidase domain-containing protein n=1 Tax=Paenibacillus sacheonensis TaxID=742054 RepID=A0A7X4YTE3_9BACL|nr:hypothetical protein [Paenibacillus sacheonensis]MBM7565766.1 hypothetical protein [Paenibacillus sacheonensis]NBC72178.1 hypothetical protein [Paenibacillus sacheonensis]